MIDKLKAELKAFNTLSRLRLKPKAILKLFPNLPHYLSSTSPSSRSKKSTLFRLCAENCNIEELNQACLADDRVDSVDILIKKLKLEVMPKGFVMISQSENVQFHDIECNTECKILPNLHISVVIKKLSKYSYFCS